MMYLMTAYTSLLHILKLLSTNKPYKTTVYVLFFCIISLHVYPQKTDSLRKAFLQAYSTSAKAFILVRLSFDLLGDNLDSALLMAQRGVQLALTGRNDTALADCYLSVGLAYIELDNKDSAEYYMLK